MEILLLVLSALVAIIGFDMLRNHTNHRLPTMLEDEARYGVLGKGLSTESRFALEEALNVLPRSTLPIVAALLAIVGSLGTVFAIYLLIRSPQ